MCGCTPAKNISSIGHVQKMLSEIKFSTTSSQIIRDEITPLSNIWNQIKGAYHNIQNTIRGSSIQSDYRQVQLAFLQLQKTFASCQEESILIKEERKQNREATSNLEGICTCFNEMSAIAKMCASIFVHTSAVLEAIDQTRKHKNATIADRAEDVMNFAGAVIKVAKLNPISLGLNLNKLSETHDLLKKHFDIFIKGLSSLSSCIEGITKFSKFDNVFVACTLCKNYFEKTMEILKPYTKLMDDLVPI